MPGAGIGADRNYFKAPIRANMYFREQHVGVYNWGFVSGKTQTIYPWDSWNKTYTTEPPVWFHDIFHPDGMPYDAKETDYLKSLTGKAR